MKKNVSLFLAFYLIINVINAQVKREKIEYEDDKVEIHNDNLIDYDKKLSGRFSLNFAIGGNFGLGGGNIYTLNNTTLTSNNISYGSGIDFQAGLGYNFNEVISAEINLNYQFGFPTYLTSTYSDSIQGVFSDIEETKSYSANNLKFTPQIVLSYPNDKFVPYVKFGPIISFSTRYEGNEYRIINSGIYNFEFEDVLSSGVGFSSSFGLKKQINHPDKFVFFEMNYIALTQSYEKGSMVEASYNDNDFLNNVDISDKSFTYVTSLDRNYKVTNPNIPSQKLKEYFNFNSWGVKIGLIYFID